jgi:hypothetical protein
MLARNGAGLASAATDGEARKMGTGKCQSSSLPKPKIQTRVVLAELTGSNTCAALGIVARSHSPILGLCHRLIEAGVDPARPLHAYRRTTLTLAISSIGYGVWLEINAKGSGYVRHRAVRAASPMRQNLRGAA